MTTIPALPDTPLAARAVAHLRALVTEPVANHGLRSHLFAELFAEHEGLRPGVDYDPELLFLACALHDLGVSPQAGGGQRFEVDGADLAAAFLTGNGVGAADVDLVWEAIALHSSPGIAERRGVLCLLTRRGVAADFGAGADFVTDLQGGEVHARHPRLRVASALVDGIVRHAARGPQNAPRYSLAGELVRERGAEGRPTALEVATASSRWGE